MPEVSLKLAAIVCPECGYKSDARLGEGLFIEECPNCSLQYAIEIRYIPKVTRYMLEFVPDGQPASKPKRKYVRHDA